MEATDMVTVRIDASKPAGRKALKELDGKKFAEIENPIPSEIGGGGYTVEEVFGRIEKKLNDFYCSNLRFKY
jgi:hypothetical protein